MRGIGKYILPLVAVGMLVFAVSHVIRAQHSEPNPPPPIEPARSAYGRTVAGAGIVEPNSENISIGSPLPGIVWDTKYTISDVGKWIEKDAELFRIDTRALEAQLAYQKANRDAAVAQLTKLEKMPRPEEVTTSESKVKVAEANVALQQDLAERARRLRGTGAIAVEDVNQRMLTGEVADRQLAQSKTEDALLKAGAWWPDKKIAEAAVKQAEAQMEQTKTEIERSIVRAPIAGQLLQVNVRNGEFVGTPPSQALMVLGNTKPLHIRVDIDEHDIPRAYSFFQSGGLAVASPRGKPDQKYQLQFVRVEPYVIPKKSLTGDNTERVDTRVLQVIYRVADDNPALFVGMQMDVFLDGDAKK